jgi:hypothetical protein
VTFTSNVKLGRARVNLTEEVDHTEAATAVELDVLLEAPDRPKISTGPHLRGLEP